MTIKSTQRHWHLFFLFFACITGLSLHANDYETRREAYIQTALSNFNDNTITLQAYKGIPVNQASLSHQLQQLQEVSTSDFTIVKMIRVLCLSNGQYDDQILPVLKNIPFWLTENEKKLVYWSENHMIMWMSSHWILKERYNWEADAALRNRLVHFLKLKIDYGYYEFFSSVYFPYTLSGLLNLVDFAQDPEIKSLATAATKRLLKDVLLLVNDKGTFYPPSGRNYYSKYATPYNQNHNNIIYLLTGMGAAPTSNSHAGGFLASSSLDVSEITDSWTPQVDMTFRLGHNYQQVRQLHAGQTKVDKIIFQFSTGGYFHPFTANQTVWLFNKYKLWDHGELGGFPAVEGAPHQLGHLVATVAGTIARSSVLTGFDMKIFKNKSISLASVQDYWKGHLGYQQWPWAANIGNVPVFTSSGKVPSDWTNERDILNNNTHLPYISQNKNVALIMYRPNADLGLFGYNDKDVWVGWQGNMFDEVRENGMWLIGREGDSYVGIYRHCDEYINGLPACKNTDGQTWAVIVGNSDMYGSFDNFEQVLAAAQYEQRWYYSLSKRLWVYYGMINVDGIRISHEWAGFGAPNGNQGTIQRKESNLPASFGLYPNPARDKVYIDLSVYRDKPANIRVTNMMGQQVYFQAYGQVNHSLEAIPTGQWAPGMYLVTIESNGKVESNKLMINR